jgi:hypothetical protein
VSGGANVVRLTRNAAPGHIPNDQEQIVMWQVLAYAGFVIATINLAYGFWLVFTVCKDFSDKPRDQFSYAVLTNITSERRGAKARSAEPTA